MDQEDVLFAADIMAACTTAVIVGVMIVGFVLSVRKMTSEVKTDCTRHRFMSHEEECPYCQAEAKESAIEAAVSVIKAASIRDQNFIPCLRGDDDEATRLRLAIVQLADKLRDC